MTRGRTDPIPPWEWVTAAVGALVVLATLVVLVRDGLAGGPTVPVLAAAVEPAAGDPHAVRVRVTNASRFAAAAVMVEGELGGHPPERHTVTLDYVPGHGARVATLVFSRAPGAGLTVRIAGYRDP